MKAVIGWDLPNTGATDSSGFSALPAGIKYTNGFYGVGTVAYWWTSSEYDSMYAWDREIKNNSGNLIRYSFANKLDGFSVRCIKN